MALSRALVGCVLLIANVGVASAQSRLADINQKTVTLLSGEAQWFSDALSIGQSLSTESAVRVLPVHGDGCIDSVVDLLQLTTIDVALLSADCVAYAERQGLTKKTAQKLTYIARVKAIPMVLLTRREFKNLTALAGRRIATGPAHSAPFAAGELLLSGLELPFVRVPRSGVEAVELLKAGAADAVLLQGLDAIDGSLDPTRFHVLGLSADAGLADTFAPALLDTPSLHGLAGKTGSLETVSTHLLLAVYNWPSQSSKAAKIKQFSQAYFEQQANGDSAAELSAKVPGWQRHSTSQQALETLTITPPDIQQGDGP